MKSWKKPTPELVDRAIASTSDSEQRRYFFNKLQNPLWVRPLAEKGFFHNPPEPVPSGDGGFQIPPWPESQYLARVAKVVPNDVVDVASKLQTDNPRVLGDLIDIALAIEVAGASTKLAKQVAAFARNPFTRWSYAKLGKLAVHWARSGARKDALWLVWTMTRFYPDPKQTEKRQARERDPSALFTRPVPSPGCDHHIYQQILKDDVKQVAELFPWGITGILVSNLAEAISFSFSEPGQTQGYDISELWCPDLTNPGKYEHDAKGPLARALTSTCEVLLRQEPTRLSGLDDLLRRQRWHFFTRLRRHLYALFPELAKQLIRTEAINYDSYEDGEYGFEFASMLWKASETNAVEDVKLEGIFNRIKAGPDIEGYTKWVGGLGHTVSEQQIQTRREYFFIKQLFPFSPALPRFPDYWARYQALIQNHGEIKLADYCRHRMEPVAGFVSDSSPISAEELKKKPDEELLRFLDSWAPPSTREDLKGPNVFGLAKVFSEVVKENPERFLSIADQLRLTNNPTCVRDFLRLAVERVKEKQPIPWGKTLSLCNWIVKQPILDAKRRELAGDIWKWGEQDFTACRQNIAGLIQHGSQKYDGAIPWALREEVFSLLTPLCRDYDPRIDEGQHFGKDYLTDAINSVRGEAVHALVDHALWIKRHVGITLDAMSSMPEVKALLEERLDAAREKSLAVHGVFGLLTPWLCHLDREWFISVRDSIFPSELKNQERWVAAWVTYVGWDHLDKPVFETIEREYWRAIEHLDLLRKQETGRRAIEGMGEHLIMLYAMGQIPLCGEQSLLHTFLEKANLKERGHVMWYTGRALENTATIPDEIKRRLSAYWQSRLERATCASNPGEASEELSHFCWWFRSGKLENSWCLKQIQASLRVASSVPEAMVLLEDLAKIASQYPAEAVTCLQVLVGKITSDRYVYLEEGHTKAILCAAMESKLPEAVKIAESAQDELLRLGRFEYKTLSNTQSS